MNKKIKLCFSTLGCAERDLDSIVSLAEHFGIAGIELRGIAGEMRLGNIPELSEENAEKTRRLFEDSGVYPIVLGTSQSFHGKSDVSKSISDGIEAIDVAERIGAPFIRVFGDKIISDSTLDAVIEGLTALSLYAEKKGVTVLLEVHGDFNTEAALAPITDALGHLSSFGILWDVCHTHETYGNRWRDFYSRFSPFIRHLHLKDIRDGVHVLPGDGELPLGDIISHLINGGYSGYFSLEWEKKWHPELPEIEVALERIIALCKDNVNNI